jgi:hypothetical protein
MLSDSSEASTFSLNSSSSSSSIMNEEINLISGKPMISASSYSLPFLLTPATSNFTFNLPREEETETATPILTIAHVPLVGAIRLFVADSPSPLLSTTPFPPNANYSQGGLLTHFNFSNFHRVEIGQASLSSNFKQMQKKNSGVNGYDNITKYNNNIRENIYSSMEFVIKAAESASINDISLVAVETVSPRCLYLYFTYC